MLWLLVNIRFQVLFHSPPGVLFTFPSRYCFTIGHWVVFRLGGWSPLLPYGFHVSVGTPDTVCQTSLHLRGSHPLWRCFPATSAHVIWCIIQSSTPKVLLPSVWPLSLSLAATQKISFDFFSSPYLDVSVQAVSPRTPIYSAYAGCKLLQPGFPIRKSSDQ